MSNVIIELLDYVFDGANIDYDKSVVGTLDVTSHSEFPLSLTFAIADIKDINARKGSFSKTFRIPATKNNNQLYKNIYLVKSTSDNNIINKKPCRIVINNLYSINGLLELTSIGSFEKPKHYSCVFYGNNISWASDIGEGLLKDLGTNGDVLDNLKGTNTGKNLVVNKTGITSTWVQDNAIHKNGNQTTNDFTVVYPIVSYGDFNPSGQDKSIQLLNSSFEETGFGVSKLGYYGFNSSGFDYGNPEPVVDWRPCLWVYDIFNAIFNNVGYTVNSNFIETTEFKKLLFALPNFRYNNAEERYLLYGFESRFKNLGLPTNARIQDVTNSQTYFDILQTGLPNTELTQFDLVDVTGASGYSKDTNLNSSGMNVNGVYTFPEYGRYDIELENFGHWYDSVVDNSSSDSGITIVSTSLQIQVQTVGETTFNTIEESIIDNELTVHSIDAPNNTPSEGVRYFPDLKFNRYFNKNDKIRIRLKNVFKHAGTGSQAGGYRLYLYGSSEITAKDNGTFDGIYNIKFNPEFVEYGQTYDLKNVINKQYKQIDFIKGVSHAFNLHYTTDEISKVVYIEPFDSFYKSYYEAIDWSDKLDLSQEIKDVFIKDTFKRDIIFKYKTDNKDAKVEQRGNDYFEKIIDEYPYKETLSNEFERGQSVFENPFFAGTFNAKDKDSHMFSADPPYIACLWQEKEDGGFISPNDFARPNKGFDFLPRLLYWKKYSADLTSSPTSICYKLATVQLFNTSNKTIKAAQTSVTSSGTLSEIYPQATSINREDINSMVLSYGNVYVTDYDDINNTYADAVIAKGLYQTYYEKMVEMLKENPRVRTLSLNLKMTDIVNLDFRKLVYIDGCYYRINKIIDFKPLSNVTTKVELIEWLNLGDHTAYIPVLNQYDGKWNNNPPSGGVQTRI
tara:strand:- start:1599 stop:4304 length:2706 start_codon:yes stop_codon:yes gene_type:complete